ncbi:hypothetical protein J7X40_003824 [Vibrio parahaemolyticus]|nr:hypothetical protein [Vibrio parahaemolyticus]HCG8859554.1 hypothetical protein [Vibrio parahaemolyticus]
MNPDLLFTAPDTAIPNIGTKAYDFLVELSSGEPIAKRDLLLKFGEAMRSPLQMLENDRYQFWCIQRVDVQGEPCLQLDERHLSGVWELDAIARCERKLKLRGESYKQARNETERLPLAKDKLAIAREESAQMKPSA